MWLWFKNWRNRRTHKGLRLLRWLGRTLFYPAFFLLLIGAILVSTGPGTHLITTLVNLSQPWLTLDYKGGQLNDQIEFHSVRLELESLSLAIDDLALDWNPWCSLQNKLCVNLVEAEQLALQLDSSANEGNESQVQGAPSKTMELPFNIEVKQGNISHGSLHIHDIEILWQQAELAGLLEDGLIEVNRAHFIASSLAIESLQSTEATKATPEWGADYWPLAKLPDTYLPFALRVKEFQSQLFELTLGQTPKQTFQQVSLDGQWQQLDFFIEQLSFIHQNYGELNLHGAGTLSQPYPLKLEAHIKPHQLPNFESLRGSSWSLLLQGDLDQLAFDIKELTAWDWHLKGEAEPSQLNLPFELEWRGQRMLWPDNLETPLNYRNAQGSLFGTLKQLNFDLQSELETTLKGETYQVEVTGKGSYSQQLLKLDHVAGHYLNQTGSFQGSAQLSHQQGLSWQTQLELSAFMLPPIALPEPLQLTGSLSHQGSYDENQWHLDFPKLELTGQYQGLPLKASGQLAFDNDWQGAAKELSLQWGDSQLSLNGQVTDQWQLEADLSSADLSRWLPDLTGPATAHIEVEGPYGDPLFQLQAQGDRVEYQNVKGLGVQLLANYRPKRNHEFSFDIGLAKARVGQLELIEPLLNLHGNQQQHQISLSTDGEIYSHLLWQGSWDDSFSHWQGVLTEGEIHSKGRRWQNDSPVSLALNLESLQLRLGAHCWSSDNQSQICLDQETQLGQASDLGVSLALFAQDISPFIMPKGYSLNGRLEGKAQASWSADTPITLAAQFSTEEIVVNYDNLVEGEITQTALEHLKLQLLLSPSQSSVKLDIASSGQDGIWLDAQLMHNEEQVLKGLLQIHNYQLGRFSSLFPDLHTIEGQINGRVTLSGQLHKPQLSGWSKISQGQLVLLSNPTPIEAFELDATFEQSRALISSHFKVGGGQAALQAQADWEEDFVAQAQLTGERLQVLLPPQSKVEVTPELKFVLTNKQPKLTGTLYLPKGEFKLSRLADNGIPLSGDTVFVDDFEVSEQQQETQLETNIQLKLGPKVQLDAFGLTGRLEGSMDLQQEQSAPVQIFGHASLHDAVFAAYGQRLTIQENSSLHFNGDPILANLDVRATRFIKRDNVTAGIHLTGNIDKPKINFFSDPTLEQQEVLSYIIWGKGFRDNDTDRSASTAALMGVTALSNLGLSKPLEKLPGITSVSLDTEGEGDETQVTISGYLGEKLFLKYGIGLYEPINEVTVRLYLMNQLWLESVTGLEKSLDLYYSFFIE